MKIHEYQAKELLAAAGAAVPRHSSPPPPTRPSGLRQLGGTGRVKAQVHAGGRGKGQFKGYAGKLGGVKFVTTREKAAESPR